MPGRPRQCPPHPLALTPSLKVQNIYVDPVVYFTDSSLLADVSYVLCLDALSNGDELNLHVSPASPNHPQPPLPTPAIWTFTPCLLMGLL